MQIKFNTAYNPQRFQRSRRRKLTGTSIYKALKKKSVIILKYLVEYCNNSSLHGLKYVFNTQLNVIERLFWLILFIVSLVTVIYLSVGIYKFWQKHPSLIVFDSHFQPIWHLPFPSITICPNFAIKKSYVDLTTTNNSNVLLYASFVCPKLKGFSKRPAQVNITNDFYYDITQAAPRCSDIIKKCVWKEKELDCSSLFHPIMTDLGLCCNFNMMPLDYLYKNNVFVPYPNLKQPPDRVFWNQEHGYPILEKVDEELLVPQRVKSGGVQSSLSLDLFQNLTEWQNYCSGPYSGFKILITNPLEQPVFSHEGIPLAMEKENLLMISPTILYGDYSLINIPPIKRNCFFQDENPLQLFALQTYSNCVLECISLRNLKECGCVMFFMPRIEATKICSRPEDEECVGRSIWLHTMESVRKNQFQDDSEVSPDCGCLPPCTVITFEVDKYYSEFLHPEGLEPPWALEGTKSHEVTTVKIYYKENFTLGKKRKLRYSILTFIGKCGGLLSLFLGFSFISAFELVYFLMIRPFSKTTSNKSKMISKKIYVKPASRTIQFLY